MPSAAGKRSTRSPHPTSGIAKLGAASGNSPTTSTPCPDKPRSAETAIAPISTKSVPGSAGANRRNTTSRTTLARPTASVQLLVSPSCPKRSQSCEKKPPLPPSTPKIFGSCPRATTSASPNRKPVITGFGTKSITFPARATPAAKSTTAETRASAAESPANRVTSPPASGPTAAAESAEVAVVALTTSERDVPRSAYASNAPGAAASPADGGSPAICAYATACGTTTLHTIKPATTSGRSHARR